MKISNKHVSVAGSPPSKAKSIIIWTISIVVLLLLGAGLAAFMSNDDTPPVDAGGETSTATGNIPVEDVPDENVIKQADIEHAVDEALSEQAATYQETINTLEEKNDTLEEKLSQFEQEDIEAYQIQIEDLRKEIETLREANEELKGANQTLSESNAELAERTTVTDVQEAYEAQIKKLEADNKELENLLLHVKQRLEDGQ